MYLLRLPRNIGLLLKLFLMGTLCWLCLIQGREQVYFLKKETLRIGVSTQALSADKGGVTQGVDAHKRPYHWHQFHFFQIGQEIEPHPTLTVASLQDTADMLLGAEWFARHRVWISYQTKTLYIMPIAQR